jgi:hypothetical protein
MILKDPNKLILPKNLNIYPVYLEKPELFTPRYFMENSRNNTEEKRQKDIIQKKAYKNFQKIINSERSTLYIQNFLNSNFNLVMKIIKKSTQKEIDKMIENPNILINPVEEYNKKNPKKQKYRFARHNSQICLNNEKLFNKKKISLLNENDISPNNKKKLKVSKSDNNSKIGVKNKIYRTRTSSNNLKNYSIYSKNHIKMIKESRNDIDSYSSYKLSINATLESKRY